MNILGFPAEESDDLETQHIEFGTFDKYRKVTMREVTEKHGDIVMLRNPVRGGCHHNITVDIHEHYDAGHLSGSCSLCDATFLNAWVPNNEHCDEWHHQGWREQVNRWGMQLLPHVFEVIGILRKEDQEGGAGDEPLPRPPPGRTLITDFDVRLRCADDLESNEFWKAVGFELYDRVQGGRARPGK